MKSKMLPAENKMNLLFFFFFSYSYFVNIYFISGDEILYSQLRVSGIFHLQINKEIMNYILHKEN